MPEPTRYFPTDECEEGSLRMIAECHPGSTVQVVLTPRNDLFVLCASCNKTIAEIQFHNIILLPQMEN